MKKHAQTLMDNVKEAQDLHPEEKSAMMQKLQEWKEDQHAADDVVTYFGALWGKLQPFFKDIGLI